MLKSATTPRASAGSALSRQTRKLLAAGTLTLFASMLLLVYLMPLFYSFSASLKGPGSNLDSMFVPTSAQSVTLKGNTYELYEVPFQNQTRTLALIEKRRAFSTFIDPGKPEEKIRWEGNWRKLTRATHFDPQWGNYPEAWKAIHFGRLFLNSFLIALIGMIATVASSTLVAYGFSRFDIPGKPILFLVLMGTIILPGEVTLIPLYTVYYRLGWVGTWLPLLVPLFFASAYNVFLLRQFFMSIPRDVDEAAMMDGAGPFRILVSIIVPQSWPALTATALFHFFYAWNDFFAPFLYLTGKPELATLPIGLASFSTVHGPNQSQLTQAASIMATLLPLVIFFLAQRVFMRGVVVTSLEK
ncbi:carbohydrate ABC transporter permease [Deinococcus cellulosilyticus]|uniref:ABC transporter permease n=1 Tax=Deinococcus cellulosilyticus (strain DSM 18568 / NBRC 106333 / KACC 11606 / 5516J-15) TaxID=1223518 RepID=A0A511N463_DEIC1|nr:carbohydrate ABC transporter permease [Deinococcus cellulosilyticus]GEM47171.1 ABC transporter permease [Deinococcus cellulosilyticus NBRC 106333 = KACC 11606]